MARWGIAGAVVLMVMEATSTFLVPAPPQLFAHAVANCPAGCYPPPLTWSDSILLTVVPLVAPLVLMLVRRRIGIVVAGLVQAMVLFLDVAVIVLLAQGGKVAIVMLGSPIRTDAALRFAIIWAASAFVCLACLALALRREENALA